MIPSVRLLPPLPPRIPLPVDQKEQEGKVVAAVAKVDVMMYKLVVAVAKLVAAAAYTPVVAAAQVWLRRQSVRPRPPR